MIDTSFLYNSQGVIWYLFFVINHGAYQEPTETSTIEFYTKLRLVLLVKATRPDNVASRVKSNLVGTSS